MANDNAVYILDSYGLIYRAYFALVNHPLTNPAGDNISAVVIFFKNLKALLSKYKPSYLAAAFDSKTKTFRHEMYPEYKASRAKTPEDLHAQIPWIEEILEALNVPVLRCDGYEADDIIATVARKCRAENREVRILSGDKDLLQLVDEKCLEMQPDKDNGGWVSLGIDEVKAKWGIGPEKILDYLSLVGDTADNVPGVKGVGDKTALKLLAQYETLEGIYDHAQEIKGALGDKIRSDRENAFSSKKLITLDDNVPLDISFDSFTTSDLDYKKAAKILERYGAYSIAKQFASQVESGASEDKGVKKEKPAVEIPEEKVLEVKQNEGKYRGVTSASDLSSFIDQMLSGESKICAFDTETDGLESTSANIVGFSLSFVEGEGIYVPLVLSGGMFAPETVSLKDAFFQLERIFGNCNVTVCMHNAKFDMEILHTNGYDGKFSCSVFDTMVAAWLLNPGATGKSPYSLESLAEKTLGLRGIEFKDIVEKGQTFADVPLETASKYGAEDSDFTLKLCNKFREELKKRKLEDLFYGMEMKLIPILVSMEEEGIHLNKKALAEYSVELKKLIEEKEKKIHQIAGHEFNIASTKQLQEVLFVEQHLKPLKKTKTGFSTDTAVLEELLETEGNEILQAILDYRSSTKLLSTYVETLPELTDKNSRIHTSFMQTGTATGRLSSRDPNLQNIPVRDDAGRRIRSAFTASNGKVLISADYAQIELVVLAHLSGDKNLSSSFINGIDVHKSTAALINGISPDQVTSDQRRFAKTVNFGVMYGMSAFRLAKDLGISRTEAKMFIDQYFQTYADVKKFLDKTIDDAKSFGYVETIMGRRRYLPEIRSSNKLISQAAERVAVNTPIQGTAADIVKTAMIKVNDRLSREMSDVKMLLQVHDELIFECPENESYVQKAIDLIRNEMEGAFRLNVPLRVSIEHGKNWGEFH